MLQARDLAFGFRGRPVGRGLDLALEAGHALCILGPNGAGKTTLMRTLLGLLPPLAGTVRIAGDDLATLERAEISRRVAYVPQASPAVFDFSVMDIVLMGRMARLGPFGRPGDRDARIAAEALEHLGIEALGDRAFGGVSGGERQLVLIARALAAQARCIVLDEPTAQLDYGNQARVVEELGRLRDQGIAILLSTHDPDQAFQLADQALLMARGEALANGPAREVLSAENLSRLYDVGVVVAEVATPAGSKRVSVASSGRAAEGKAWR